VLADILLLLQVVIVIEGTRGIDFLFGIIIAVVCANWIAQFVHKDGVYESELDHDGNVFFLRTEAPNALQYKTAADVSALSGHLVTAAVGAAAAVVPD